MGANPLAADLDHILDHTRELWEDLRGERLFLTGGTGFFGSWLLESFAWANERLALNASVGVLTRNPLAFRRKAPHLGDLAAIRFHKGDIRSFRFPSGSFAFIIHAATESNVHSNADDPLQTLDTTIQGARRVLEFARRHAARKMLLTSSGAVYGRQPPGMTHIPETYSGAPDPADPASAFGQGKRVAEWLSGQYARQFGFEAKIARCFAFVGPYLPLDRHFAIGNFIRDGLNGGPIIVKGDGTPRRSYLYMADLAIWLWTILFRGKSCDPYNVGSDEGLSIAELAQQVARQFHQDIPIQILGKPNRRLPLERYVPEIQKIRADLKMDIWVPLPDAIQRTIQYPAGV